MPLGVPLGGFIYAASQGLQSVSYLLLQVEVLGLAGFLYPSSGLLPWQEPGRQISKTEGSYPRQQATDWLRACTVVSNQQSVTFTT
jgi:hypothetical protein